MPIKKSAIKRAKQSIVRRDKNRALKKNFRETVKTITKDLHEKKTDAVASKLSEAYKALDKAAKNNAIHKNAAARRKSRLTKKINAVLGKAVVPVSAKIKQENKKAATEKKVKQTTKKSTPKKSTGSKTK